MKFNIGDIVRDIDGDICIIEAFRVEKGDIRLKIVISNSRYQKGLIFYSYESCNKLLGKVEKLLLDLE